MLIRHRKWSTRAAGTAAAVVAGAVLAACGGGGSPALSESGLHDKARGAAKETKDCPIGYDLDKAASAAHVGGQAAPVRAVADLPEDASDGAVLRTAQATDLTCEYRLGSESVSIETVAAAKGNALTLMAPLIQRNAEMSTTNLETYVRRGVKAPEGTAVVTRSGNVASVRLHAADGESAVLVVSYGTDGHTKLTAAQVSTFTEKLAGQATW